MIYRISNIIQGLLWLIGLSLHNKYAGECCPDFSCCRSGYSTPFKVRVWYLLHAWLVRPLRTLWFKWFRPSISRDRLCSGFGFFPDGSTCNGCMDCRRF